jgi:cystathionine beta-synthase
VSSPYLSEGIGEDILPENMDFSAVDHVEQVSDRDAFLTTRALAKREGLFVGGSCGAAMAGALAYAKHARLGENDLMVVLLPDSGTRYVSKIYNDEWMQNNDFLDSSSQLRARDILSMNSLNDRKVIEIADDASVGEAITIMNTESISQIPVKQGTKYVGAVYESSILSTLLEDSTKRSSPVREIMDQPFPVVTCDVKIDQLTKMFDKKTSAVLVSMADGSLNILTKSDLIQTLSRLSD